MKKQPHILFCENPLRPNNIDPDYEDEFLNAGRNGFETLIFNFDDFINEEKQDALRGIKRSNDLQKIIYRGWMLTPTQYSKLYSELLIRNYQLINSVEQYQNCHYLPDSLKFIEDFTPKTVFHKLEHGNNIDAIIEKAKVFGQIPVIIKDYVKSEKHDWATACFVNDASDIKKLRATIDNLINLRGKHLNEGIVVRTFVALNELTRHSKSGMPLTEEYRLFFYNKTLIDIYDYWEEGAYEQEKPDTAEFERIAEQIDSTFFSMDIARQQNGKLIIIELGDGQVAGLPEKANTFDFYKKLKDNCLS